MERAFSERVIIDSWIWGPKCKMHFCTLHFLHSWIWGPKCKMHFCTLHFLHSVCYDVLRPPLHSVFSHTKWPTPWLHSVFSYTKWPAAWLHCGFYRVQKVRSAKVHFALGDPKPWECIKCESAKVQETTVFKLLQPWPGHSLPTLSSGTWFRDNVQNKFRPKVEV